MSEQTETSLQSKVRFVRPDMPRPLWAGICIALSWLLYSVGCAVVGYYLYRGIALHASSSPEPQHYRLSEELYIYKKRPLMILDENGNHRERSDLSDEFAGVSEQAALSERLKLGIGQITRPLGTHIRRIASTLSSA